MQLLALCIGITLGLGALWEAHTSLLQSWLFTRWASSLTYSVERGPSDRIVFPHTGPFDERRGYTRLPEISRRLRAGGFVIADQARQSPALTRLIRKGITPPYRESPVVGLVVRDRAGATLFAPAADSPLFRDFDAVPPLVARSLLFIENRDLGRRAAPRANPAVDWRRLAQALFSYAGRELGLDLPLEGGSTLATQLEKFRHSPGGRTPSPEEKLRQMVGASLAAYRAGPDTRTAREQVIVDYLNTMPLGAAAGVGEIHGLGEGLRVWFGMDLDTARAALEQPRSNREKARAFRVVLALIYAAHAPTYYLTRNRHALERRVQAYADLLRSSGLIDGRLCALVKARPLIFATRLPPPPPHFIERKAVNAVRLKLEGRLPVQSLSDLDGLNLRAETTLDGPLQAEVTGVLRRLASPQFIARHGLNASQMLSRGDPRQVIYSFLLLESSPDGNLVRVHTDTLDAPFDINDGMKLELGSTAKLRTLAHYLGVMAELYGQLSASGSARLERRARSARDPLTRWAQAQLCAEPGLDLASFLNQSLERRYSASPAELFFTGGGVHRFHNFEPAEDHRVMTVRDAFAHSTNLVFIRLMRDLVRFHEARLPYDARAVLGSSDDPVRRRLLEQIANQESRNSLARAYLRYRGLGLSRILERLLGNRVSSPRELAIVLYAWHRSLRQAGRPESAASRVDANALAEWLGARGLAPGAINARRLERAYGNPRLTLADFAYLSRTDPLGLWCAGELARDPRLSWHALLARSGLARRISMAWLFKTRNRKAQERRLRIRIERDAFVRMTPYWRQLGFPFATLVPSYATAIGSSADRPAALAELMGIILNDGRRQPTLEIRRLTFGAGTPYETLFERAPRRGEPVMLPAVARLLRTVLADVIEHGTARRLRHAFVSADGAAIPAGGKTGTGDNRLEAFARGGRLLSSHPVNRTAAFVFYLGDRWFGVITASVVGPKAKQYAFTSALPLAVLKLLSAMLTRAIDGSSPECCHRAVTQNPLRQLTGCRPADPLVTDSAPCPAPAGPLLPSPELATRISAVGTSATSQRITLRLESSPSAPIGRFECSMDVAPWNCGRSPGEREPNPFRRR